MLCGLKWIYDPARIKWRHESSLLDGCDALHRLISRGSAAIAGDVQAFATDGQYIARNTDSEEIRKTRSVWKFSGASEEQGKEIACLSSYRMFGVIADNNSGRAFLPLRSSRGRKL